MATYAPPIAALIAELERLPGIGPKSAQRLAFHILRGREEDAERLSNAIRNVKTRTRPCVQCFNFSEGELCPICSDARRESATICVVAEPRDLIAIENAGGVRGTYHVLQGLIAPMDGVGPDQLRVRELLQRLQNGGVNEVILATSPTVEGDATAMYLAGLIKPLGIRVTQLAIGLPAGGDLDYADQVTISRAVEGRREL